jgi:ABC-2 type transport system permease protein
MSAAGYLTQSAAVARRSITSILREPGAWLPALLTPMCIFAVQVGALGQISGAAFDVPDYVAFQLPVAMLIAASFSSAGHAVVTDITSGYFDKLCLTPARRSVLLVGRLAGEICGVLVYTAVLLNLGLLLGVRIGGNPLVGAVALYALMVLFAIAYDAIGIAVALRTGSPKSVQAISFMVFFPLLFITPWSIPREHMTGWFATLTSANPLTYLFEAARSVLGTPDQEVITRGLLVASLFSLATLGLCVWGFRQRLRAAA